MQVISVAVTDWISQGIPANLHIRNYFISNATSTKQINLCMFYAYNYVYFTLQTSYCDSCVLLCIYDGLVKPEPARS